MKLAIFPYYARFIGLAFILLAIPFAYLYFLGGKPDAFNLKTFAFVTTYSETKYFVWSQTNVLDELAAILVIAGVSLFSFSKERVEKQVYESIRLKALVGAFRISIVLLLFSFLLVYGAAIFVVLFSQIFILIGLYNILFRYYLVQYKKEHPIKESL